jgi:hypothetical protein
MWTYLSQCYHITGDNDDDRCNTHIWISKNPRYDIGDIKRICQAGIHFEPAYDALMAVRNGSPDAKSNWVHGDRFALLHRTRRQSIEYIQPYLNLDDMGFVMQTFDYRDVHFSWNFQDLIDSNEIEFRKPPVSTEVDDCLGWAEFTVAFILAAVRCQSPDALQAVPSNVKGLRWFLSRYTTACLNESPLMQRVWGAAPAEAMADPVICFGDGDVSMRDQIDLAQEMIDEDRVLRREHATNVREPYY